MIKAHKIRLHPTLEQTHSFAKAAGTARFCLNWAVAEWQRQYEAERKPSALALRTQFNAIKKDQFLWVCDVTKCATLLWSLAESTNTRNLTYAVGNDAQESWPYLYTMHPR